MNLKSKLLILGSSGLLGSELMSGLYFNKYQIFSQSLKSESDFKIEPKILGRGSSGTVNKIEFLKGSLRRRYGKFAALKPENAAVSH